MERRGVTRKRRSDAGDEDDDDDQRPLKRGKEEADEDDDMSDELDEYDTKYSSGRPWSEEEDARLIMLRTYVHRSGLRLGWTHVAERMPNRSKEAVVHRWRQIASEQQQQEHALQVKRDHKPWDEEQDEQLRALKRQGLTDKAIAAQVGRSVGSVKGRWRSIADDREKRQCVPFSDAEDRLLIRLAKKRPRSWQRIARRCPGRSVKSLKHRLYDLQHSANKRTGKWTRREQVLVRCYVAAGAKPTLIAKRLGTRTPSQVQQHISRHKSSMATPWCALQDERLRNAVAAAKRLGEGEGDDERAWTKDTWRWVARYVGRGWFDCSARVDVLRSKAPEWTHAELVELARVMLLPAAERASDYHVAFGRMKRQCTDKWSNLKRCNPTLLASVVAEATGEGSSSAAGSSSSSSAAASAAGAAAVAEMGSRARLVYALSRRQ